MTIAAKRSTGQRLNPSRIWPVRSPSAARRRSSAARRAPLLQTSLGYPRLASAPIRPIRWHACVVVDVLAVIVPIHAAASRLSVSSAHVHRVFRQFCGELGHCPRASHKYLSHVGGVWVREAPATKGGSAILRLSGPTPDNVSPSLPESLCGSVCWPPPPLRKLDGASPGGKTDGRNPGMSRRCHAIRTHGGLGVCRS